MNYFVWFYLNSLSYDYSFAFLSRKKKEVNKTN